MKDILLINPPVPTWGKMKKIRETSPPLGILSVAAFIEQEGKAAEVLDLALEPEKLSSLLNFEKGRPRVVGITSTTYTISSALKLAHDIKKADKDIFVVFGGPHPTIMFSQVLENDFVDCVVIGEGEITFNYLCAALLNNEEWRHIQGIVFRNNGNTQKNPPRKYIEDLDILPFPARHLVPFEKYRATPINYKRWPSTPVITARGCPFKCTFCSNPVHGRVVRFRSPENVIKELILLKEKFGIKDVSFWDDTFTLSKERVRKFCALLKKENLDLTWSCECRVDTVNEELLRIMKEAGCWQIYFGIESGVERLRKEIKKGISEEQIITAFKGCKKNKIETGAFFMLGIPTETREESFETIEFAKKLNPDFAQFTLVAPYPGCELFDEAVSKGWIAPDWEKFQTYPEKDAVYVPEGRSGEELISIQTKAFKSFYIRPAYIMNRLRKIKSSEEFKKHLMVFWDLLKW